MYIYLRKYGVLLEDLVQVLLNVDADRRPSSEQILCIPVLQPYVNAYLKYTMDKFTSTTSPKLGDEVAVAKPQSKIENKTEITKEILNAEGIAKPHLNLDYRSPKVTGNLMDPDKQRSDLRLNHKTWDTKEEDISKELKRKNKLECEKQKDSEECKPKSPVITITPAAEAKILQEWKKKKQKSKEQTDKMKRIPGESPKLSPAVLKFNKTLEAQIKKKRRDRNKENVRF